MIDLLKWKFPNAIVDCSWLYNKIGDDNIRVYDCTTYLHYTDNDPNKPYIVESGFSEYKKEHIPHSAYIDLQKDLSNNNSKYRFTLPNHKNLAKGFSDLGIGNPYKIVLYSRNGLQWSTRIWWMLYYLGFENAAILDGGFNEWKNKGLPVETNVTTFKSVNFDIKLKKSAFVTKDIILKKINDKSCILLNALTNDIHRGDNTRYGRPGRIPNSINIPFHKLINEMNGKLKEPHEVMKIFEQEGITSNHQIINYCGGGIAATLDAFVLYQLGFDFLQVYDNSLSEWAIDEKLPMERD